MTRSDQPQECALWYMSYHVAYVELCPTEMHAVHRALSMEEYETGSPDGVQFPDGTYYAREDWEAYKAEERRRHDEMLRSVYIDSAKPQPALVRVKSPAGRVAEVEAEDFRPWMHRA